MDVTLRTIRNEHAALRAVLQSILLLLQECRRRGAPPDFETLRAMLFYVDEFPEQRHHRKETQLLFPKLRARSPLSRDVLDRLDNDHERGGARIRELEHLLLGYELMGEPRRAAFEDAAQRYVAFYLEHMRLEEEQVLPLAQRVLLAPDWAELDEAFAGERDPLAGAAAAEPEYHALFTRIVNRAPAPIGVGPAAGAGGSAARRPAGATAR